jgi:hypothetical protein
MIFEMRLSRPVSRRPARALRFAWRADDDSDSDGNVNAVGASIVIGPRRTSASHYITSARYEAWRPMRSRPQVSRDRRLLRVRVRDERLRGRIYRSAFATFGRAGSPERGTSRRFDLVKAFFPRKLEFIGLEVEEGGVTVTTAFGARVKVIIRRRGDKQVVRRYRQDSVGREGDERAMLLRYPFSCPSRRTTYRILVRARDSFGNRRSGRLLKRCAGRHQLALGPFNVSRSTAMVPSRPTMRSTP